jgi:hypothetical protein
MSLARLAVGACAAMALAAAPSAEAKGGKGGGSKGGAHHGHGHHGSSHHHGGHGFRYTSVFVGGSFVFWPSAYYWPDYHPGSPAVEYWYYCQPYAAYYPYVQECPTDWQPVLPTAPLPGN